jgi:endonuclease/exonuclease/phosphatase family metal-dependent hydrolase
MRSTERARPSDSEYRHRADGAGIQVVTWNIRAAIGPGEPFPAGWWRHVTDERFGRICAVIRDLDADVVALQEVSFYDVEGEVHDQPLDLARSTGRHVRYGAVHAYPLIEPQSGRAIGSATWGNALLTREPIRDWFTVGLPVGGDDDHVEPAGSGLALAGTRFLDAPYGTREPRCAVGGTVAGEGGLETTVMSTHLAYAGAAQRAAQAQALARTAAERAGPDGPLVLLGDFNAAIDSSELRPLASTFGDAFTAVGVTPGDARRRSCGDLAIDHILVRGFSVDACRVVTDARDASDHLPVVATLRPHVG